MKLRWMKIPHGTKHDPECAIYLASHIYILQCMEYDFVSASIEIDGREHFIETRVEKWCAGVV